MIENFIKKLQSSDKCYTYEFSSPLSFTFDTIFKDLENKEFLKKIDAFVCTDSPLAKLKHSSILASLKLQNHFKIPSVTTISMRDKNSLALQSSLIGMNSLDLRLVLALTGDPLRHGNQLQAKGVFEGNSLVLLKIINQLNAKKDINDNLIKGEGKEIYGFCVMNSYANNIESLYKKMKTKIQAGAKALFTQPIYDIKIAKILVKYLEKINTELQTNCVLVFGFFPITSYKTALFLHNKLPGVFIPDTILEIFKKAQHQSDEEKIGLEFSTQLFENLNSVHNKIHIMSANKSEIIENILKNIP